MSKAPKREERGLSFPVDAKGDRSTSLVGKNIIAAAMRGAKTSDCEEAAVKCEKEKVWRFKYSAHYMKMVKLSAQSPEAALGVAQAGLDYMHSNFDFIDPVSKKSSKFDQYMKDSTGPKGKSFKTGTIAGEGPKEAKPLVVPYKGKNLSQDALKKQLNKWADYGTIERDAADAIGSVATADLDLTDEVFVLIGAGSAMGPFGKLLEHGATVVCIDIPSSMGPRAVDMWKRLIDTAKKSKGKILFPMRDDASAQETYKTEEDLISVVGCNLTEQPAEIANWLLSICPGKTLTVGNYTYLDSDLHVKLSLAADSIMQILGEKRPDTNIAFLCTPTDIHVVTDDAHKAAKKNYGFHPGRLLEGLIQVLSMGKLLKKNALPPLKTNSDHTIKIVDGLSVAQGPNYALAKRIQHWRCMVAYANSKNQGCISSHIAPSTATLSVVSNKTFGWAYGGMPYFEPYEIFQADTTNSLMAAILIYDVSRNTKKNSGANPKNKAKYNIKTPLEIFRLCSLHGGVWRAAYKVDSIGEISVLIHFLGGPKLFLFVAYAILIGLAAVGFMLLKKFNIIQM
jgi:hypothetical protein